MVNILNEDYESIILNTAFVNDQDQGQINELERTQILSNFTGIDPDGKSFLSLSGCKDEKCFKEIISTNDLVNVAFSTENDGVINQENMYVHPVTNNSGDVTDSTYRNNLVNYLPNKYFTLSVEERNNKQIFNIGRDDPTFDSQYKKLVGDRKSSD